MRQILLRIAFLTFAVGFTLVAFNFWGKFSGAMGNLYADHPKPIPKPTGDVTMTIIQPKSGPTDLRHNWDCNKQHPCPKP